MTARRTTKPTAKPTNTKKEPDAAQEPDVAAQAATTAEPEPVEGDTGEKTPAETPDTEGSAEGGDATPEIGAPTAGPDGDTPPADPPGAPLTPPAEPPTPEGVVPPNVRYAANAATIIDGRHLGIVDDDDNVVDLDTLFEPITDNGTIVRCTKRVYERITMPGMEGYGTRLFLPEGAQLSVRDAEDKVWASRAAYDRVLAAAGEGETDPA